jgi:hypothetical protein
VALVVLATLTAAGPAVAGPAAAPTGAGAPTARADARTASALTARERAAALVLARARARFLARYAADPDRPFTTSFMSFRRELHGSALYRVLRLMPKGGLLHVHATGIGDAEWVVRRAFTEPDTYVFWGPASETWARGQLAVYPQGGAPEGFVAAAELERAVPNLRAGDSSASTPSAPRTTPSPTSGRSSRPSSSAWTPSSRTGPSSSPTTATRS